MHKQMFEITTAIMSLGNHSSLMQLEYFWTHSQLCGSSFADFQQFDW